MSAHDDDLRRRLAVALARAGPPWRGAPLEALDDSGLAHWHVRLAGHGVLARIPKQSQMALYPEANLAYQSACFERAAASGHTPRLHGVLPVCAELPRGGLLVEDIVGRAATLPRDLGAIARALAALHALPLPPARRRPPLDDAADPLVALRGEIERQAGHLAAAGLEVRARAAIDAGLEALRLLCDRPARPAKALISFDAHPGNFIVRTDGQAVLVDLEKCRYSHPPLDLAHATLYTSTSWDIGQRATLTPAEVAATYAAWGASLGERGQAWQRWHLPLRRAMWLWSLTWCAKWRVVSRQPATDTGRGEDWSASASTPALADHVRERVDHYLSAEGIARVLEEFEALVDLLPGATRIPEAAA